MTKSASAEVQEPEGSAETPGPITSSHHRRNLAELCGACHDGPRSGDRPRRRRSPLLTAGSRACCIVSGEYAVKLPAYVGQETACLGDLAAVSSLRHLHGGRGNLPYEVT